MHAREFILPDGGQPLRRPGLKIWSVALFRRAATDVRAGVTRRKTSIIFYATSDSGLYTLLHMQGLR